jgi:hypothetical protein
VTKKDYEKAAALCRRLSSNPEVQSIVVVEVMAVLADLFASDNPRFDRDKFTAACMKEDS